MVSLMLSTMIMCLIQSFKIIRLERTGNSVLSVFFLITISAAAEGKSSDLSILNSCTCPGYVTSYECQVVGGGFTVWRGLAFDCRSSNNEIILPHTNFNGGTARTCNSGNIIGRSLSVTNECYTSRLEVNITTKLDGRTVECVYESGISATTTIGSAVISLTRVPYPPPDNIWLMNINPGMLTFNWNRPAATDCSSLQYHFYSDCGVCPQTTNLTSVSCTLNQQRPVGGRCSFAVRSIVCGNITGNWSSPVYATIKVPVAPVITGIVSKYGTDDKKKLIDFDIKWSEVESFTIFEGVSGATNYYTAFFSNTSSERATMCGSTNVSASHCLDGVCTASLPPSCYQLDGNISVSVSATNSLGEGLKSQTLIIAATNQYVDVTFESARRVVCKFLGTIQTQSETYCSIRYGPCQEQLTMTAQGSSAATDSPTTVRIDLNTSLLSSYCYSIKASNGTFTWLMDGRYENPTDGASRTIIVVIMTAIVLVAYIIIIILLLYWRFKRLYMSNTQSDIVIRAASPEPVFTENRMEMKNYKENCETDPVHIIEVNV